jgi:cystathionine beta-lyase/cystathionine gamma-synthase
LSFELADNVDADRFVNDLKLFTLAVSLGSVASLAELPWTMTHAELPVAARKASGLSPQLIRLAIGVESVRDLIEDLDQALAQVG